MQDIYTKIFTSKRFWKISIPVLLIFAVSVGLFLFKNTPKTAEAGWWNESWNYRKTITINHNYVVGNLENFPVLVSLTDTDFIDKAQDDGDDFVFTSYSGNEILKYEIESYASSTGEIFAWVKLPNISSTTDTLIWMYYGNASVDSQADAENVWDENYVGVWHLGEATSTDRYDSSGMGNTLADYNNVGQYSGKIGNAADFELNNSTYLQRASTSLNGLNIHGSDQTITLSAWVWRESDPGTNEGVATMWEYGNNERQYLLGISDADKAVIDLSLDGTNFSWDTSSSTAPVGEWHYITGIYDDTNLAVLFDAQLEDSATSLNTGINNSQSSFSVGAYFGTTDRHFDGLIDEVRISNINRSLEWTETEYNNQNNPSTFLTVSAEEVGLGPVGYWTFDEGYGTTAHDNSLGGNNGTISGATWQDESMCVAGKCLYFDGVNQTEVEADVQNNMASSTVCLWMKANSLTNADSDTTIQLFNKGWGLNFNNSGTLQFQVKTSSTYPSVNSSENIVINKWYYVCTVYSGVGNNPKMYLNGYDKSASQVGGSGTQTDDSASSLMIGSAANADTYNFNGFIDDVKIYPYPRTANQIKQDYNAGLLGVSASKGASVSFGFGSNSWMTDGLVGYWKLDETATTSGAIDSSGNGNDGTYYNNASTTGAKFGNGGIFDASDGYVQITNESNFDFERTDSFSFSFWLKTSTSNRYIVGKQLGSGNMTGYNLAIDTNSIAFDLVNDSSPANYISVRGSSPIITDDSWHHIVATYDGSSKASGIKFYVDGKDSPVTTVYKDTLSSSILNNVNLDIGHQAIGAGNTFNGKLDEFRIYNRVLSGDEAKKIYEWAPGPILHLKMDEKQGTTVYDTSGYGNDGSLSVSPDWTRGKIGSAVNFDGTNQKISIDYDSIFDLTENFTVSMWIKPEDVSQAWQALLVKGSTSGDLNRNYSVYLKNDELNLTYYNGGWVFVNTTGANLQAGQWYFVTYQRTGTNDVFYLDGQNIYDQSFSSAFLTKNEKIYIGGQKNNPDSAEYFEGVIDDVKIYNYARTQKQILEDMSGGRPASKSSAVYYKFDKGHGSTVYDWSGHGNDATANSSTGGTNTSVAEMWDLDGKYNKAMEFDGTDDKVDIGDLDFLDSASEFSVSVWVKYNSVGSSEGVFNKYNSATSRIFVESGYGGIGNDAIVLGVSNGASSYGYTKPLISIGEWAHWSVVFNGNLSGSENRLKFYYNGEKQALTYPSAIPATTPNLTESFLLSPNGSFDGLMDELKIFNYALSDDEAKQEYNRGSAAVFGSAGTDSSGNKDSSQSRKYCVPGDTATCNPPILEFKMDEKTGSTAYDTSGNGFDGTFASGTTSPSWTRGRIGSAVDFSSDASNYNYISVADSTTLTDIFSSGASLSFWIKPRTGGYTDGMIMAKRRWLINLTGVSAGKAKLYFEVAGDTDKGKWTTTNTVIDLNSWNFVSLTYTYAQSSVEPLITVNGSRVLLSTNTSPLGTYTSDSGNSLYLGDLDGTGVSAFDGVIDNVTIYDYIRTPAQIAWEYNKGKPAAHYRFDECQGSTIYDWSGNANNGTISIGASSTQTAVGNCTTVATTTAWYNGADGSINSSLSFDGTDDYVSVGDTSLNINSVSFWTSINNADNYFIDLDGGTSTISISAGEISTTGFSSPSVYADAKLNGGIRDDGWHYVTITTDTAVDVNNFNIGKIGSNYLDGLLDELKLFSYPLSQEQVKTNYSNGTISFGLKNNKIGQALWLCGDDISNENDGITYKTVLADDGNCWLKSNLGTANVATAYNDSSAYGGYYQWGRGTDGHQLSTSNSTSTLSSSDTPGHGDFIISASSPKDWRSPQNDNLWQGVNGTNNPCPTGWRVPSKDEWSTVVTAEGITNYTTAASSNLKLTAAGIRLLNTGAIIYQGIYGYYRSASISGTLAYYLRTSSFDILPADTQYRANGYSVRCLKD